MKTSRRNLIRRSSIRTLLSACTVFTLPSLVLGQSYSVDESLALSRKTGRPIFAMAGDKT